MISWTRLIGGQATVSEELLAERIRFEPGLAPIVVWNLTRTCNLRCMHCYQESGPDTRSHDLDPATTSRVLKDLCDAGVRIVLFSGGEPLLRPDLFSLIEQARDSGMRPVISTNGTLLDENAAKRLKAAGCAYVGVSLDGLEKTHDAFRKSPGAFRKTLVGLRRAQDEGLLTGVRFTLTRENQEDLDPLLNLVEEKAIPRFCLYHLVYAGRGRLGSALDVTNEKRRLVADLLFRRAHSWSQGKHELLSVDNHADGLYLVLRLREKDPQRAQKAWNLLSRQTGCPAACKIACMDPEGQVHPCQFWPDVSLGSVTEESFKVLWDRAGSLALRSRNAHLKGRCAACMHKKVCGGCRVRAEHHFGDPWQEDPACYLTDEEIATDLTAEE